ncbi:type II toxin-antitoxin system HicB family antitoxin [Phaeobacter sp. JH20_30]|uniref:type II toxin-antitoxin system HicB family antitoxin n=1 Tax=unclassified Phaeobacter TaxID=2621772 RepID=UPI003A835697
MQFIAVVHHEEGSAYGVHFPDVPGCYAAADNPGDILKHAIIALDDFFADGHEVPEGRDIEAIRKEAEDDLKEGAYLMMVPHIPRPTKVERVNVTFDRSLLEAIDQSVELTGLKNRSAWLAMAAKKEIQQEHNAA